jgi:hypothetical protein
MGDLFVISKKRKECPRRRRPRRRKPRSAEVPSPFDAMSGDVIDDLEMAVRALSFLLTWICENGPKGIERTADAVAARLKEKP